MDPELQTSAEFFISEWSSAQLEELLLELLCAGDDPASVIAKLTGDQLVLGNVYEDPYLQVARYLCGTWTVERLRDFILEFADQCTSGGILIRLCLKDAFIDDTRRPVHTFTKLAIRAAISKKSEVALRLVVNKLLDESADQWTPACIAIGHNPDQRHDEGALRKSCSKSIIDANTRGKPLDELRQVTLDCVTHYPDSAAVIDILTLFVNRQPPLAARLPSEPVSEDQQDGDQQEDGANNDIHGQDGDNGIQGVEDEETSNEVEIEREEEHSHVVSDGEVVREGTSDEELQDLEAKVANELPEVEPIENGEDEEDEDGQGRSSSETAVEDPNGQDEEDREQGSDQDIHQDPVSVKREGKGKGKGKIGKRRRARSVRVSSPVNLDVWNNYRSQRTNAAPAHATGSTPHRSNARDTDAPPRSRPKRTWLLKKKAVVVREIEKLKAEYKVCYHALPKPVAFERLLALAKWVHSPPADHRNAFEAFRSGDPGFNVDVRKNFDIPRAIPYGFDNVNDLVAFLECAQEVIPEFLKPMGIPIVDNLMDKADDPKMDDDGLQCSRCFCKWGVEAKHWL